MNELARAALKDLHSSDKDRQNQAFTFFMKATAEPVDWAYDVWDSLANTLTDEDNRRRAIAAQVLCNLAKSGPKGKMRKTLGSLLAVTKDERFVTARHCMQAIWKAGAVNNDLRQQLIDGLAVRFTECAAEKNPTLIRYDIIVVLCQLFHHARDESIRLPAQAWIATEPDGKYRKQYSPVWSKR